jgi:hypothetical protein
VQLDDLLGDGEAQVRTAQRCRRGRQIGVGLGPLASRSGDADAYLHPAAFGADVDLQGTGA